MGSWVRDNRCVKYNACDWITYRTPQISNLAIYMDPNANFKKLLEELNKIKYLEYIAQNVIDIVHISTKKTYDYLHIYMHLRTYVDLLYG